jgi:radical SAM superfamily enzyme YgiQ (UPF0313 family)
MSNTLRYEIGPIRPPNEAYSLLVRFTRNCPWNRCLFCHTYKGRKFNKRPVDEIKRDIDTIKQIQNDVVALSWRLGFAGRVTEGLLERIFSENQYNECYRSVALWIYLGGKSVFIQDADSLIMGVDNFIEVLRYLKEAFPSIERVTTYARSKTIAKRLTGDDLKSLKEAGLTRIHIGLESGSDHLLNYMQKGVTKEEHIMSGRKVMESGIELSEYVVLGMGGRRWWREHATETADVLNKINPDFIRFRTLKVTADMPLFEKLEKGEFVLSNEEEIVNEERFLIENLENITSYIKSDHILNLLEEVEGRLPDDKEKMLSVIDSFLSLSPEEKIVFRFGRRAGIYRSLHDLKDELTYFKIKKQIKEMESKEPGSVEKTLSLFLDNYI